MVIKMDVQQSTYAVKGLSLSAEMHLNATPEQVFATLTTGVAHWWDAKHLESKKLARDLILEPRLGGRFYETWEDPSTDKDGALLGNVIQIRRGQILKIAGFFGFEELNALSVVTFKLRRDGSKTAVHFNFDSSGNLDDVAKDSLISFWTELLHALKDRIEHQHSTGLRANPAFSD